MVTPNFIGVERVGENQILLDTSNIYYIQY